MVMPALALASSARRVALRLGSWERPGTVTQKNRGDPDPARPDRLQIQLLGADLEVGGLGEAVEVEREVVRREDLAEGDRGRQAGHGGDEAVVDPEAAQGVVQVLAEGVLAGAGDDRAAPAVAG